MPDINVFIEVSDGSLNEISLQALGAGRALSDGGTVRCLAAGTGAAGVADELFQRGADEVRVFDDARVTAYTTRPYRRAVTTWLAEARPALLLCASTTLGDDLAAAVAGAESAACVLSADEVALEQDGFVARRIEFDRKVRTTYAPEKEGLMVVSLKDGAAEAPQADPSRSGHAMPLDIDLTEADLAARVLKRDVAKKTVNLRDAKVIVAAGAGVGSTEGLDLVRQLADALGAEIGATRAVVDAGWLPADHQIGQTGATVRPDLYIGCGISGAVQHQVGMLDARKIIAINTDANAPIFKIAHYKVVGDLKAVVPKLLKAVAS